MFARPIPKWLAFGLITIACGLSWRAWVAADDPAPPACHVASVSTCSQTATCSQMPGSSPCAQKVAVSVTTSTPTSSCPGWQIPVADPNRPREVIVRKPNELDSENAIEAALENPITVDLPGATLQQVTDFFQENCQIEIRLDEKALAPLGITPETEVHLKVKGVKLSTALALLGESVADSTTELAYVIRNESLLITTRERGDSLLETRIYDVRCFGSQDPQPLQDLVMTSTDALWRDNGGSEKDGTIVPIGQSFVIRQNQRVHREIQQLLSSLAENFAEAK